MKDYPPPPPTPPPPPQKKKKKKVLDHYLHHDLGMLPLLQCFFAHLLILQYPDHHQNLISSSLYYSGPVHKISSQSVHNFLSNVVHRKNRQTDRQTNQRYQKHNLLCQGGNKAFTANGWQYMWYSALSRNRIPWLRRTSITNKYTKITEVDSSTFVYRLFHADFSSIVGTKQNWLPVRYKWADDLLKIHAGIYRWSFLIKIQLASDKHPELSGCITTLTSVQQWTP